MMVSDQSFRHFTVVFVVAGYGVLVLTLLLSPGLRDHPAIDTIITGASGVAATIVGKLLMKGSQ